MPNEYCLTCGRKIEHDWLGLEDLKVCDACVPHYVEQKVVSQNVELRAEVERLRKRTHEIAMERDKREAEKDSQLAYWHNLRDEVKAHLERPEPWCYSTYQFHGAMLVFEQRNELRDALMELLASARARGCCCEVCDRAQEALERSAP